MKNKKKQELEQVIETDDQGNTTITLQQPKKEIEGVEIVESFEYGQAKKWEEPKKRRRLTHPVLEKRCLEVLRQGKQENVVARLKRKYPFLKQDEYGNLYHINENTPLLCAHCDNVGDDLSNAMSVDINIYIDEDGRYFFANYKDKKLTKQMNIGADDKIGVGICTYLFDTLGHDKVSVLFTLDEEIGTQGSGFFVKEYADLLDKCTYCLIADRRGSSDIIASGNDYCGVQFEKAIAGMLEQFDYKPAYGVYSDCDELSKVLNCVNLSCGYYNAHTNNEYAMVDEIINCMNAMKFVLTTYNERLPIAVKTVYTPMNGKSDAEMDLYTDEVVWADRIMVNIETGEEVYIPAGRYMEYNAEIYMEDE